MPKTKPPRRRNSSSTAPVPPPKTVGADAPGGLSAPARLPRTVALLNAAKNVMPSR